MPDSGGQKKILEDNGDCELFRVSEKNLVPPPLSQDMQKVENLPPADLQDNIFRKGAKSNALTRTFECPPIFC